ncbi:MAG: choice-of-anchor tandem repeat GloVer-containing protein, partial [Rhodanobacteraceae bacterium]
TYDGGANGEGAVIEYNVTTGSESVLYSFGSVSGDGTLPYGSLIQASDGNLYGMTYDGGANGGGAVIEYNVTTGSESVLHSFGSGSDGALPRGSLIQASDGNLYGMTYDGGANNQGTVFTIN